MYILRRHLAGGREKMHALRQPRCAHAGSHCTTRKRTGVGICPAPETPTEPAAEDISSNSTESLSEAEPTPEAEDTPSNSPDGEDIYSRYPTTSRRIFPPAMRSATNPKT